MTTAGDPTRPTGALELADRVVDLVRARAARRRGRGHRPPGHRGADPLRDRLHPPERGRRRSTTSCSGSPSTAGTRRRPSTGRPTTRRSAGSIDGVLEAARVRPPDPDWPGLAPPAPAPDVDHWDEATADATPDERAAPGPGVRRCRGRPRDGRLLLDAGASGWRSRTAPASGSTGRGDGRRARRHRPDADGRRQRPRAPRSGSRTSTARPSVSAPRARPATRERRRPTCEPGRYEVVLEPDCVAEHPVVPARSTGSTARPSRRAARSRASASAQFDPSITLRDDVTDPGDARHPVRHRGHAEAAARPRPRRRHRRAAAHPPDGEGGTGVESTGHAVEGGAAWGALGAQPRRSAPGDASTDELIAGVERGVLVTDFWYTRILDPRTQVVTGLTRNGVWLIEDGRVVRPVTNLRFTQSFLDALGPGNVAGRRASGRCSSPAGTRSTWSRRSTWRAGTSPAARRASGGRFGGALDVGCVDAQRSSGPPRCQPASDERVGTAQSAMTDLDYGAFDALTFDCYGTLIDWEAGILAGLRAMLAAHDADASDDDACSRPTRPPRRASRPVRTCRYRTILAMALADGRDGLTARAITDDEVARLRRLGRRLAGVRRLARGRSTDPATPLPARRPDELRRRPLRGIEPPARGRVRLGPDRAAGRAYKPNAHNFEALPRAARTATGSPPGRILHVAQSLYHDHAPAKRLGFHSSGSTAATTSPAAGRPHRRMSTPTRRSRRWRPSRRPPFPGDGVDWRPDGRAGRARGRRLAPDGSAGRPTRRPAVRAPRSAPVDALVRERAPRSARRRRGGRGHRDRPSLVRRPRPALVLLVRQRRDHSPRPRRPARCGPARVVEDTLDGDGPRPRAGAGASRRGRPAGPDAGGVRRVPGALHRGLRVQPGHRRDDDGRSRRRVASLAERAGPRPVRRVDRWIAGGRGWHRRHDGRTDGALGRLDAAEARGRGAYRALVRARWDEAVQRGHPQLGGPGVGDVAAGACSVRASVRSGRSRCSPIRPSEAVRHRASGPAGPPDLVGVVVRVRGVDPDPLLDAVRAGLGVRARS